MEVLEKWYKNLTFEEAVGGLDDEIRNIKKGYVAAGFYMKYIRDNKLYEQAGYNSVWEFAEASYGIAKSTASRWMAINDKFSKDGNSPFLKEQFEQFEKSQLQEMLYLDDKQMEKVTPDMTTKEIREIRKPAVVEEVSILGHPLRVYPEGSLIASRGCEKQDCFSCHRDGCNLRQEDCWCVEATFGNPFSCTTLKVVDALREEIGSKCQFVNEDLAFHRAGDGQPVPCCKKCNNPCGYECRRSSEQRYKERLSKPDEKQEEYLKAAAKHLILRKFEWFKEKNYERVVNTTMIPMEIKAKCLPNNATWYFATEIGVGHINLFEKYVQLWDEKSNCIGNFEWFYFARAIQVMWQTIDLEKAEEQKKEIENHSVNTESKELVAVPQQEEIQGQMNVYDYPEMIPEDVPVIEAEYKEIKSSDTVLTYLSDIELLKRMLDEDNRMLKDMLECCTDQEEMVRKQKLKITALASMLGDLEEPEEPEKPELPIMKNNEQRKKFLESYKTWPVWFDVPEASETYYRFDLPDKSSIVVCEYCHYVEWKKKYGEDPEMTYHKEYLLKPGYKYLHDCKTNQTALLEHLKNVQRGK